MIPRFPRIDLNVPAQRNAFAFFSSVAFIFIADKRYGQLPLI